jgi:ATP-dependent DNA helicase PIF1
VVLGGDFRQILPVVKGTRAQTVSASIKKSFIWNSVSHLRLNQNMRVADGSERSDEFKQLLLTIGEGREDAENPASQGFVIPEYLMLEDNTIDGLVKHMFGENVDNFDGGVILGMLNSIVREINNSVSIASPGEVRLYVSADSVAEADDINPNLYPPEFLNMLEPNGMPAHELRLKVGHPIILLRNINPNAGLCNGTRLVILEMHPYVLKCRITHGLNVGEEVFIPRIACTSQNDEFPFQLLRRQFPVSLCFAMTVNKSQVFLSNIQGQSIDKLGIYLGSPAFAHGQLYVALSRATDPARVKIVGPETRITKNIVYKDVFT